MGAFQLRRKTTLRQSLMDCALPRTEPSLSSRQKLDVMQGRALLRRVLCLSGRRSSLCERPQQRDSTSSLRSFFAKASLVAARFDGLHLL